MRRGRAERRPIKLPSRPKEAIRGVTVDDSRGRVQPGHARRLVRRTFCTAFSMPVPIKSPSNLLIQNNRINGEIRRLRKSWAAP